MTTDTERLIADLRDLEAKLAEVTASNAKWTDLCVKIAQDEMRATVATLTAQVEAMRGALEPFAFASIEGVVRQKDGHVTITTCAEYFHRARAALTTEKTNGME